MLVSFSMGTSYGISRTDTNALSRMARIEHPVAGVHDVSSGKHLIDDVGDLKNANVTSLIRTQGNVYLRNAVTFRIHTAQMKSHLVGLQNQSGHSPLLHRGVDLVPHRMELGIETVIVGAVCGIHESNRAHFCDGFDLNDCALLILLRS